MRPSTYYPSAEAEARSMVAEHDGGAIRLVEKRLGERVSADDVDQALHLDRVRRAIERIEATIPE